jgi:hypothetical protein
MHSAILLAVEAEDAVDAVHSVENFNEHNAGWSDWNTVAGRWADTLPNGVLRYTDNPELFMETVKMFQDFTKRELERLIGDIGDITIRDLALDPKYDYPGAFNRKEMTEEERDEALSNSLARYKAGKLAQLINGYFSNDSHFYDIDNHTMKDDYLLDRIKENPERQFIVVWDYHH